MNFNPFSKFIQKNKNRPKEKWKEVHMGMGFLMILYISLKNLKAGKIRSVLTIGGVALGIGVITFLLSMGFGVQKLIVEEVTKNNPLDIIDVSNGNLDSVIYLNEESIDKIKKIDGVGKVEKKVNVGGKIILGESQTDAVVFGVTEGFIELAKITYQSKENKFSNGENRAIISSRLSDLLGLKSVDETIGKKITYNIAVNQDISSKFSKDKKFENSETEIVGVVKSDAIVIYLPFEVVKNSFEVDLAQEGKVQINNMEKYGFAKQSLEQMGFVTESVNDLIKDIDSFFNTVRAILAVFGIIIMSISVMGMLNTLSISLLQRTKEIGILKALGTKRLDIFKMFILEAILISFIGGIIGFLGGYGIALLVNKVLIFFGQKVGVELYYFVYVPNYFSGLIAGFIFFLGVITGIMPATRASGIHALEALRYE
ncbi:MAG: hypothetical protein COZ85_02350 [Candidatus Moranbacteria bacterium CG_4_8_14_3_um_filter_34_16]|nr:MAG: hypothetical protein COT31_03095 [Candidatus Moranbacteria bacterium CG08_land_8_20_14_0_20_34_16]PIW94973.1 MAG: hypothetical protein COZ85_02350 [Candidatus Moranbacteria bacterium CG_4_8_14_3_um_filter_34_16]